MNSLAFTANTLAAVVFLIAALAFGFMGGDWATAAVMAAVGAVFFALAFSRQKP